MKLSERFSNAVGSFDFLPYIKREQNGRMRTRFLALQSLLDGKTVFDICDNLKIARNRVRTWANKFIEFGIDGLKELPGRGRKSKLSAQQKIAVADFIEERSRCSKGGRLFGEDVRRFIMDNFGHQYNSRYIYEIIHELNFSWVTSRSISPKCDKAAQEEFKKNLA